MKQTIQLSDHFTYGKLFRFTLPSIAMMVFTSIYSVVDGFFISNFAGKTAFAALNLIWPFLMILGGMGFMIGTGGTALVSRYLGAGDSEKANRYFAMMIELTILLGAALTAIGLLFMEPISRLLGATEEMVPDCVLYGRIVIAFNIAFMLQNVFQSFLIALSHFTILVIVLENVQVILIMLLNQHMMWHVKYKLLITPLPQNPCSNLRNMDFYLSIARYFIKKSCGISLCFSC